MLKKSGAGVLIAFLTLLGVAGCAAEERIIYQDKERPVSEVEEIISDQLEQENPSLDLDVSIQEEVE